jgi:tetratricopeptide (TPR) repeat protein
VHITRARDMRRALRDRPGLGRVLNSLGASYYQLGEYEPALDAFVESLALRREEGDASGIARVLTNIGKTYHDWHQYDRALEVLDEAVATAERANDPGILGYALNSLAMVHIDRGSFDASRALIARSRVAYDTPYPERTAADSLSGWSLNALALGRLLIREGRAAEAIPVLDSVLRAGERRGSVRGQARAQLHLGEAYRRVGDRARAAAALEAALALSRGVEQRVLALEALRVLALVEEEAGNTRGALAYLRAHQALRDTVFDQGAAQRIAGTEARAATEREQRENARLREEQRVQAAVIARQRLAGVLGGLIIALAGALVAALVHFNRKGRAREDALRQANADLASANTELRTALSEVRTLKGLIPICSSCKQVRDDSGYWQAVEHYLASHSDATFSHGICESCGPKLYGAHWHTEDSPVAGVSEG